MAVTYNTTKRDKNMSDLIKAIENTNLDIAVYQELQLTNNGKLMKNNMPVELAQHMYTMIANGKLKQATFMESNDSVALGPKA